MRRTSKRKIEANRANARRSTGPKTRHGRKRSARNSFRHGLSIAVLLDPSASAEVKSLSLEIVGPKSDLELLPFARGIAEAEIDLRRIRRVRHELLARLLNDGSGHADLELDLRQLSGLDRYERRACRAASLPPELSAPRDAAPWHKKGDG